MGVKTGSKTSIDFLCKLRENFKVPTLLCIYVQQQCIMILDLICQRKDLGLTARIGDYPLALTSCMMPWEVTIDSGYAVSIHYAPANIG